MEQQAGWRLKIPMPVATPFDTVTRIAAGDDGTTYDNVSIALHWATALLVIVQFALGQTWDWFAKPTRDVMESTHVSLGMLLAAVIVARLIWRLMPGHEVTPITSGWIRIASRSVHLLLYLLLVGEVVLGFGWRWAQGHPVDFFGLISIPGPYGQLGKPARGLFHELHEWGAWAIIAIATLHALGALYHHYVLKDRVLTRMLPGGAR